MDDTCHPLWARRVSRILERAEAFPRVPLAVGNLRHTNDDCEQRFEQGDVAGAAKRLRKSREEVAEGSDSNL